MEMLVSHKSGASAVVAACLAQQSLKADDLSNITLDRLQTVLGNDPDWKKLLSQLGDKFRSVLQLNGTQQAQIPTILSLPGPFTIEAWVKLRPGIDNRDSIGGANDQLDLNFAGGLFRVYVGSHGGDVLIAKKKIIADLWTHVAATRDASGRFKIYINGELDHTSEKPANHPIDKFLIGWSTPQGGTDGQFAEYRIWNRERSATEIRNFFDRSLLAGDAGLLYNGSNDQGWGATNKAATLTRTLDLPPVMSLSQATEFDKTYQHYLGLIKAGGHAESGKTLAALCSACHQFGNSGGNIGPNLSSVGAMGPEAIVRNILTPNAAIEPGYRIFRVTLKDGSLLDAFFVSEDKDAIVVRQMGAGDKRIERKNIVSTQFLRQSLMPEGLLASLTDQQRKDLFAYLMSLK
jgi:putative heme-binding domain-containing protein